MAQVVDHPGKGAGRTVPRRIVSLCPSVTETLFTLGVGSRVVGRTRHCIHPRDGIGPVAQVGGTKTVNLARVEALRPDLIVAVREENEKAQVRTLMDRHEVLLLDPVDIASALDDLTRLGQRVGAAGPAQALRASIEDAFAGLPRAPGVPVAYLIWRRPYMAVGAGTYIGDLLKHLGLVNVATTLEGRYPKLDVARLRRLAPRLILASSEPFPFREAHLDELRDLVPGARAALVDGEMFGWHGARMLTAAAYFGELVPRLVALAGAPTGTGP